jgi:hypothetical protein
MAEQSFLAKLGVRLGILGSSASLAIAAPLAVGNYDPSCQTDSARIGWYFDRTLGVETLSLMVGGVQASTSYAANNKFQLISPSPVFSLGNGAGTPGVNINGANATNRQLIFNTNGSVRWNLRASAVSETGSDAGSNWNFDANDGTGTLINSPISIFRAGGGVFNFNRPVTMSGGVFTTNTILAQYTATWNFAGTFAMLRFLATDTASDPASLLVNVLVGNVSRFSIRKDALLINASVDDLTSAQFNSTRTSTLGGAVTDGIHGQYTTTLNGAFTITRYNWFELDNITGAATITDATVFDFDAAAGTHKCIDAGTTKTSPGTVSAWIKHNINGTIYYSNAYTSKTS